MSKRFGVAILSAGASRRMGSPKALLRWRGGTMLAWLVSVWREAGASRIAVVHDPRHGAIVEEIGRLEVDGIANREADEGMMSSVRAAARWDGWDVERVAVALVDQPWIPAGLVRRLAEEEGEGIWQPVCGGRRGHPVFFGMGVFRKIGEAEEGSLRDFIGRYEGERRFVEWGDGKVLEDMDTPEDYRKALGEDAG